MVAGGPVSRQVRRARTEVSGAPPRAPIGPVRCDRRGCAV